MNAILDDNNGRRLVTALAGEHTIRVTSEENTTILTAQRAHTRIRFMRKESEQYAVITFRDHAETTLTVYGNDDIENLRLIYLSNPEISGNNDTSFRMMFAIIIICVLGAVILLADYLDVAAGAITRITPKSWETYTANLALERMRESGTCANPDALHALARLVNPLTEAAAITGYPPLRIIPVAANGGEPKFFALPGAVAVINDAYLAAVPNADHLAAAIARQLVRIRKREPLKRFIAGAGSLTFAAALLPFLHGTEPAASAASRLLRSESAGKGDIEEDKETVQLMVNAGFRAHGTVMALRDEKNASFLPSPSLTTRINRLDSLLRKTTPPARPPLSREQMRVIARICE